MKFKHYIAITAFTATMAVLNAPVYAGDTSPVDECSVEVKATYQALEAKIPTAEIVDQLAEESFYNGATVIKTCRFRSLDGKDYLLGGWYNKNNLKGYALFKGKVAHFPK